MIDGTDQPPAFEFRAHDMRVFLLCIIKGGTLASPVCEEEANETTDVKNIVSLFYS